MGLLQRENLSFSILRSPNICIYLPSFVCDNKFLGFIILSFFQLNRYFALKATTKSDCSHKHLVYEVRKYTPNFSSVHIPMYYVSDNILFWKWVLHMRFTRAIKQQFNFLPTYSAKCKTTNNLLEMNCTRLKITWN